MTRARHAGNAQTTLFDRRTVLIGTVHLSMPWSSPARP